MKKIKILLFAFMLFNVYLYLITASTIVASPPPSEVKEIREKSPLQVIGEVEDDVLLKDESQVRGYPNQRRSMFLRIEKILKKPTDLDIKSGESLNIVYSYIPSWVPMDSGAKMDIVVGDKIEIWLELREEGWEPALGGETVNHLKYIEPRKEPIPEPIYSRAQSIIEGNLEYVVFVGFIFILALLVIISQRFSRKNGMKN